MDVRADSESERVDDGLPVCLIGLTDGVNITVGKTAMKTDGVNIAGGETAIETEGVNIPGGETVVKTEVVDPGMAQACHLVKTECRNLTHVRPFCPVPKTGGVCPCHEPLIRSVVKPEGGTPLCAVNTDSCDSHNMPSVCSVKTEHVDLPHEPQIFPITQTSGCSENRQPISSRAEILQHMTDTKRTVPQSSALSGQQNETKAANVRVTGLYVNVSETADVSGLDAVLSDHHGVCEKNSGAGGNGFMTDGPVVRASVPGAESRLHHRGYGVPSTGYGVPSTGYEVERTGARVWFQGPKYQPVVRLDCMKMSENAGADCGTAFVSPITEEHSSFDEICNVKPQTLDCDKSPIAATVNQQRSPRNHDMENNQRPDRTFTPDSADEPVSQSSKSASAQERASTNTGEKRHTCDICSKSFSKSSGLKKHRVIHDGIKSHPCTICKQKFLTASYLKQHYLTHTGEKRHTSSICQKGFSKPPSLKRHRLTHQSFTCKVCNKSYSQADKLRRHVLTHTGGESYTCNICDQSFSHPSILKEHYFTHTCEKLHTCKICQKSFITSHCLDLHVLSHTADRTPTCEVCHKSFTCVDYLRRHRLTHTLSGETPYTCNICQRSFSQSTSLQRHYITHTCENPIAVTFAGKTFKTL